MNKKQILYKKRFIWKRKNSTKKMLGYVSNRERNRTEPNSNHILKKDVEPNRTNF